MPNYFYKQEVELLKTRYSVGQIDSKTDSGWKDHLNRIAEKHPESNLGKRYRRQGVKESRTRAVLDKHRKRAKNK